MLRSVSSLFAVSAGRDRATSLETRALLLLLLLAAIVRFWGVGSYGLHKPDEDTTALPAVHILQDGTPRFPSGMLYTRAIVQSYLIAASVMAFGQTEWALRLPSVLCGLVLIVLAGMVGRRFLAPAWNIAFMAIVSFLPALIADSQEVRMYIFLLASLAAYAAFIFRWERTGSVGYLIAAAATMVLSIQFHQLAIFGSLIMFFPALIRGDARMLRATMAAFIPVAIYFVYSRWTPSPYPVAAADYANAVPLLGQPPSSYGMRFHAMLSVPVLLVGACIAWLIARQSTRGWPSYAVGALLMAAVVAQLALCYHIALLLYLAGVVLAQRNGGVSRLWLMTLVLLVGIVAVAHVLMLQHAGAGSMRKILGVMTGQPSFWPFLLLAAYSPVVTSVVAAALGAAIWTVAHNQRVPDYWLFLLLAVWIPLAALGLTGWYFPPRYTEFALLPVVMVALAACQQVLTATVRTTAAAVAAAAVCGFMIVNPIALARAVNAGDKYADHKGAADYMRTVKLASNDIVVAEEVLMQTYYLGHVDYWLVNPSVAANFVERVDGKILDQYTHTPLISRGRDMQALLDDHTRGAIYVIGSGEAQADGRRFMRGDELYQMLQSGQFRQVYVAKDGLTKVWKVDAPRELK